MPRDNVLRDSVGWDTTNWSRCLTFWERNTRVEPRGRTALEVGAGGAHGNLSLWLATKGFRVLCSGVEEPSDELRHLHASYGFEDTVDYERIDVLDVPYRERFDVVVFKSLLGFFGMGNSDAVTLQRRAVSNMWKALRPGGELWFAEGACGSTGHRMLRDRFGWGRQGWRYVPLEEIDALLSPFGEFDVATFGLLGLLGRSENQRRVLGAVDRVVGERFTPDAWHYIVAGVARKEGSSTY